MGMMGALWAICPVLLPPVGMSEQPPGELQCDGAWWKQDCCSDPLVVCVCIRERRKKLDRERARERERS